MSLLILVSMDLIAKLYRRSRCIGDRKWVLISFSSESSSDGMLQLRRFVNPEGNKKLRRGFFIRVLQWKMYNAITKPTKQHTLQLRTKLNFHNTSGSSC